MGQVRHQDGPRPSVHAVSFQVAGRCHAPLRDAAQGPGRGAEQVEVPPGPFEEGRRRGGPGGAAADARPVQVAGGVESDQLAEQAPVRKARVKVERKPSAVAVSGRSRQPPWRGEGAHEMHPLQEQVQPLDATRSQGGGCAGSGCWVRQGAQPRYLEPQVRFGDQTRQFPGRERSPEEFERPLAVAPLDLVRRDDALKLGPSAELDLQSLQSEVQVVGPGGGGRRGHLGLGHGARPGHEGVGEPAQARPVAEV